MPLCLCAPCAFHNYGQVGRLYKWLAKVLENRLKLVLGEYKRPNMPL